jgi:hypothetical protein
MNYFPYDGQNGIRSYKSNGQDDEFEYYFLIICSYLYNLGQNLDVVTICEFYYLP